MPTRRAVLAGIAASGALPAASWAALGAPVALSAVAGADDDSFAMVGLDSAGRIAFRLPLPARGHAAAAHPTRAEAVAIARRPGDFAHVIDCASGALRQVLQAPPGRHFYGHAAFSADGEWLFTTENDIATGAGRIGIWRAAQGYRREDECASGGIGPHEIIRLPDGTLAVANGGIRTHPGSGRDKLNLDTMRPNLSLLSDQGALLDQAELPAALHQNSLRHIAALPDGTIGCGFQWQGDPYDAPPLLAFYRRGKGLRLIEMPDALLRGLDGYIGSIAALGDAGFAASCPRAGRVITFQPATGISGSFRAEDICGLSPLAQGCLATDGAGRVYRLTGDGLVQAQAHRLRFDNHLVAIRGN